IRQSAQGKRYETIANQIDSAIDFMQACGVNPKNTDQLRRTDFFTSHEGLLLGYEQALTRQDSLTGEWYDCSAHMLWIGDRTRQPEGAHVEFMSGIHNPIGIKVGPGIIVDDLLKILEKLNPENIWGKISIITRFGADQIESKLPIIIRAVKSSGFNVGWICDAMHGNTYCTDSGRKTRAFNTILKEIEQFFKIHDAEGSIPGGVHFELTGDNVTECVGGAQEINIKQLEDKYETACDPRLNNEQSLELAFQISDLLKKRNERR
ncbi:MAG: 3-deoxy-7-phosphoheptulonate synthase, partial [Fidelibacterota bacterium]